jgi:phosphogluconate dehydratase
MGCANLAHAFAALPAPTSSRSRSRSAPNIGVVTAYNDMLSAHQPYQSYPAILRDEAARHLGATVQVAGGVPAMCDGVTQGTPGMELSLFSRDAIAMATAVALSHDVFDGALLLGVCDKIVPGLLIGALHYGHLPCVFVPAGPMGTGLSNKDKAKVREQYAQGLVGREELLQAETAAYHSPGTCTFYGTANSNQMLLEAMGLHVPGAAFAPPGTEEREAFTRQAVRTVLDIGKRGRASRPSAAGGRALHRQRHGGAAGHGRFHQPPDPLGGVARSAGILIDWTDFDELSSAVPLLARVYPNGDADVNQFQAAGGPAFVLRELLDAGFMHADVISVNAGGIAAAGQAAGAPAVSGDEGVCAQRRRRSHPPAGCACCKGAWAAPSSRCLPCPKTAMSSRRRRACSIRRRPAGRLQGGRTQPRHGGRGALPGPARQRHARAAQAHAAAGRAARPGLQGGAGHRRAHERRVGQGARCHPRHARGAGRRPAGAGARWRHGARGRRGRHAGRPGGRSTWWLSGR